MSAPPDLSVRELAAGYGGTAVVTDVTLEVPRERITLVIGPNGSGKSTLAKSLAGVIPKLAGTVLLGENDVTRLRTDQLVRMGIGYVPQVRDVFDPLSVSENLQVSGYTLDKVTFAQRREEVFTVFPRLAQLRRRTAVNLSGGERKMLAIARVLLLAPAIVIIDEPTAGLSPRLAEEVLVQHVVRIAAAGAGVLLIEQRAADALRVADTVCVMSGGRTKLTTSARDPSRHEEIVRAMLGEHAAASSA
jgi:ABC-type branched-subunit amino acid transport system ATPase component